MKSVRAKRRGGQPRQPSPRRDGDDDHGDEDESPIIRLPLAHWPAAALLVDADGHIAAANRAAARLFGWGQSDLRGVAIKELMPAWRPLARDPKDARAPQRSRRRRATGHRRDGSTFPLRFVQIAVSADDADDTQLVLVVIRPRASFEEDGHVAHVRDRHSEQRLRAAVKAGRIGTWVWDLRRRTVWWDKEMYKQWGQRHGILPISTATALLHPDDREWVSRAMHDYLHSDAQEIALEFRLLRQDGATEWVAVKGEIERDAEGRPTRLVGASIDVTARRQAEEALRQSQRIEALGTLAGGIAHDFNNILLAIAGNTRLAMQELPSDHPVQGGLAEIAKATARASDLVNRILTFSRESEYRREIIQLQPAVAEAIELLRATLPAMIEIDFNLAEDLPPVRADATQIHQIMMNLVTNAVHAIGEEGAGRITVSLDEAHVTKEAARGGSMFAPPLKAGRYVRLSVSDTGSGMDRDTLDRVFDPFFTTKPMGRGTGLGLSVVDGIMRNHEGSVTVSSEPGEGTTFRLYFPVVDAPTATKGESLHEATAVTQTEGPGRHVMYIDDEEALVYLMTRVLQRSGYRVTGFSEAEQALQALRERPQEFDAVVTDLSMPGMSGFHVARAIKKIRSDLPVVVTSGYVRAEDRQVAKDVGVSELVLKPDTVEELAAVLKRILER